MKLLLLLSALALSLYGQSSGTVTYQVLGVPGYYCADAGSTDAYACAIDPPLTAYRTGTTYTFKANTANTGAATINLNSLGAKTIKKATGGVTTDLATNDILVGQMVTVVYDGTNMQFQSTSGNTTSLGDVSLASGIFSRAGTLGLSATGTNNVTITSNGNTLITADYGGGVKVLSSLALAGATTWPYNFTWGPGVFQMGSETRAASGMGSDLLIGPATGAQIGSTNQNGGDIILTPGTATGNGSGAILAYGVATGASGTSDSAPVLGLTVTGDYVAAHKNLLVGSDTPSSNRVHIVGTGSADASLTISDPGATYDPQINLVRTDASAISTRYWLDNSTGSSYLDNRYDNATGNLYFRTRAGGTALNNLSLFGSGRAAIGSASDDGTNALQVTGTIAATGKVTGVVQNPGSVVFGSLPGSPVNGDLIYCSDCNKATPCTSGGSGALAKRINGAWDCD